MNEGLTQIDVDYVVFDPYSEYKSVYATIVKDGVSENIPMSASNTHMIFTGLTPDTLYNVKFYYTTIDKETKESIITKFEEVNMRTKKPEYSVSVYKISGINKEVSYRLYLQDGYAIDKINMTYTYSCNEVEDEVTTISKKTVTKEITVTNSSKVINDSFSISGCDIVNNSVVRINIDSVSSGNKTTRIDSYATFKIGG